MSPNRYVFVCEDPRPRKALSVGQLPGVFILYTIAASRTTSTKFISLDSCRVWHQLSLQGIVLYAETDV